MYIGNATTTKHSHPRTHPPTTPRPRNQMKERRWPDNDQTNDTYETTDAQTKKNCNRGIALERPVEKLLKGLNQPSPLILMQLTSTIRIA